MITYEVQINLASQVATPIIQAVQGDTGRSFSFVLSDYTIPDGATATYYVAKPSGEAVYNSATISGNSVICDMTAQSLAETGENQMQVRILSGDEVVTSFEVILMVRKFYGEDAIESGSESNIFDQAVEAAAEQFQTDAEAIVAEVVESIPDDYTALSNQVTGLNERLDDVNADFNSIFTGEKKYENVSVNLGTAVNNSTGGVGSFPTYTTWATSDLYEIPPHTSKIESNFNQGAGGSSTFGFAIYDSTMAYVTGGQDLSVLTIQDNYKYIRMTNYSATSDHSGLYITFVMESSFAELGDDISAINTEMFGIASESTGVIADFYGVENTNVKRVEITNKGESNVSSFTGVNTGRNLVSQAFTTETTQNGITFTPNADGSITVNGTATANTFIVYGSFFAPVNDGESFRLTGCAIHGGATRHRMYLAATGVAIYDYGEGIDFTVSGKALSLVIYIPNGEKAESLVFKPMVTHNDVNTDFEKPMLTSYTVSLSTTLAPTKTLVIENGRMSIDGVDIGASAYTKAKSTLSHFWAYSTSDQFEVKVIYYENENYVNDELYSLNDVFNPFSGMGGKSVVTYGDSLTWYDGQAFTWGALQGAYCYGYQHYLRNALGMITTNRGQSGQTTPQICARIKEATDLANYDYLTMMSGDNDDRLNVSVGTLQPVGGTFDTSTVIGSLQSAIEYALAQNPKLRIILMTPPIGWTGENGALDRVSSLIPNGFKQVAEQYALPLIDLYHESGINELTRNTYYLDPADTENVTYMYHPNNLGWKRLSAIICTHLVQYANGIQT